MKEISILTSKRAVLEIEELEVKKEESLLQRITQKDIKSKFVKFRMMLRTKDKEELKSMITHLIEKNNN